ncbi:MAG: hypothetical protein BWX66_00252 [Deltaproteobacteria bacterium ADurb.Bin058]|nr:MAG: hypothetical protein BWX66_00252 [Deltaproteobacteria bacterium ADurb.Bin058]
MLGRYGLALLPGLQDFNPTQKPWRQQGLKRGVPIIDLRKINAQLAEAAREYRLEIILRVQSA